MGTTISVTTLPKCDFCDESAQYDAKTIVGPWAYMCEKHFGLLGRGRLGTGWGQRLVPLVTK